MYPDFSFFIKDLTGLDIPIFSVVKTFGLFLALSFVVGGVVLMRELKRKEKEGLLKGRKQKILVGAPASLTELILNGVFGFVLGFKLLYIVLNGAEFVQDAAGVLLSTKGSLLGGILGAAVLVALKYREKKRSQLPKPKWQEVTVMPHQRTGDIVIAAAISGILGAKLFDLLEHPQSLINDPLGSLFSGAGLAIYGGLIVSFIFVPIYVKRQGITVIHVFDAIAPVLILTYALGRVGCQLSGDGDWGIPNLNPQPAWLSFLPEWMWAYDYPHNVVNSAVQDFNPVPIEGCEGAYCTRLDKPAYPTPFYETIMGLIIFAILWLLRKRIQVAGMLFCIYLMLNGVERFFIEKIRINERYDIFGLQPTQAEIISILFFVTGLGIAIYLWRRHKAGKALIF